MRPHLEPDDELREEVDLSQMPIMLQGRHAPERRPGKNLVLLDPEVARAFPADGAVNTALLNSLSSHLRQYKGVNAPCRFDCFLDRFQWHQQQCIRVAELHSVGGQLVCLGAELFKGAIKRYAQVNQVVQVMTAFEKHATKGQEALRTYKTFPS